MPGPLPQPDHYPAGVAEPGSHWDWEVFGDAHRGIFPVAGVEIPKFQLPWHAATRQKTTSQHLHNVARVLHEFKLQPLDGLKDNVSTNMHVPT